MEPALRHNIYKVLRAEILGCELAPNLELREQALAERFAVSKSPVRDALLRLEQDRLVIVSPRQGYRVAPVSLEDAKQMFQLRRVLEVASVEGAISDASDAALRGLESFRRVDVAEGSSRLEAFIDYNRSFHQAIARASGNARMARVTSDLIDQMERLIRFSVAEVPHEDTDVLLREHGAILDALIARDRRTAQRLVKQHVMDAEKRVVASLTKAAVQVANSGEWD